MRDFYLVQDNFPQLICLKPQWPSISGLWYHWPIIDSEQPGWFVFQMWQRLKINIMLASYFHVSIPDSWLYIWEAFIKIWIQLDWESIRSSPRDGLNFCWQTSSGDHSETFLLSKLFCETSPSWLKVIGGAVGLVCWVDGLVGWWVGGCGWLDGWPLIFLCHPLAFWKWCMK